MLEITSFPVKNINELPQYFEKLTKFGIQKILLNLTDDKIKILFTNFFTPTNLDKLTPSTLSKMVQDTIVIAQKLQFLC